MKLKQTLEYLKWNKGELNRSRTASGVLAREVEHAQSKRDFINKIKGNKWN